MKNRSAVSSLVFLFFIFLRAVANVPADTLVETVRKSFPVSKHDRLVIDNQYGDVTVKTWDKQSVSIEVTIRQSASKNTSKQISGIQVIAQKIRREISCRTLIDTLSPPGSANASITYQVFVPAELALRITNKFGAIRLGNHSGNVDIVGKFGKLSAGNLTGPATFRIEQVNVDIEKLSTAEISGTGFDHIRIRQITGKLFAALSSGSLLDVTLAHSVDTLSVKADNIGRFNLRGTDNVRASYKISALLSKLINQSDAPLTQITSTIASGKTKKHPSGQNGSQLLLQKKIKEAENLKKTRTFEGSDPHATSMVRMAMAFSVVYLMK